MSGCLRRSALRAGRRLWRRRQCRSPGLSAMAFPMADSTCGHPVLEPEAVEPAIARLEEGDHRRQIVRAADAIGHIIAAARIGPAGIALLVARGEFDDLCAPLRPAARAPADVVRKPDLVERHHMPLRPMATAREMSAATCVRDCRKLSTSRVWIEMLTTGAGSRSRRGASYSRVSRRESTRSPRCRIAGTSS